LQSEVEIAEGACCGQVECVLTLRNWQDRLVLSNRRKVLITREINGGCSITSRVWRRGIEERSELELVTFMK
jgi:hypothetical protein